MYKLKEIRLRATTIALIYKVRRAITRLGTIKKPLSML